MARVSVTASATRLNVVDPGKDLNRVIGRRDRIVHLGIYRDWEELDRLVGVFNVHLGRRLESLLIGGDQHKFTDFVFER